MTQAMERALHGSVRVPPHPPAGLEAFPQRELERGEVLYRAGDPADTVFRVDQGLVKLAIDVPSGKERIVGVAGPGDLIGALAPHVRVLREGAEALSPRVVVGAVPRDAAVAYEHALFVAAGKQLMRVTDALEDGDLPVRARLARTLVRLGDRFGQPSEEGTLWLTLPLTHEHLAAMVGAARETTTALLGEMRRAGVVHGTRGRYRFRPAALRRYAAEAALG